MYKLQTIHICLGFAKQNLFEWNEQHIIISNESTEKFLNLIYVHTNNYPIHIKNFILDCGDDMWLDLYVQSIHLKRILLLKAYEIKKKTDSTSTWLWYAQASYSKYLMRQFTIDLIEQISYQNGSEDDVKKLKVD